jgi:FixJ family two-component response regulator
MVVDDDAQVRQAIRWTLEDEGLAVVTGAASWCRWMWPM